MPCGSTLTRLPTAGLALPARVARGLGWITWLLRAAGGHGLGWMLLYAGAMVGGVRAGTPPDVSAVAAFVALEEFRFGDAATLRAPAGDTLSRPASLAKALGMLNNPPKTDSAVEEAAGILRKLVADDAGDEIGGWARYHLGRIVQIHAGTPRSLEAMEDYRSLLAASPASEPAQQALLRLAMLYLYEVKLDWQPEQRAAAAEALSPQVTDDFAAAYHLLVGRGLLYHRLDSARVWEHLRRADVAGIMNPVTNRANLVALGELARALGWTTEAENYYVRFLEIARRDARSASVRDHLEEVRPTAQEGPGL